MRIGVIGGGAVGLLIGSYLSNRHQVTVYVNRLEQKELLESKPLTLFNKGVYQKESKISARLITEIEDADVFFVCVKQAGIKSVVASLMQMKKQRPIIFTQNGMGHLELVKHLAHPTYIGIIEHGAVKISDNEVNHLGNGQINLAAFTGEARKLHMLHKELHMECFKFMIRSDAIAMMEDKLIVNAVINPLTALFDVRNKAIIENEEINYLAKKLCRETAFVLNMSFAEAWEKVQLIAQSTGENTSSMRADIINNRPTEIKAISGYLLEVTEEKIPFTLFVYRAILALEKR